VKGDLQLNKGGERFWLKVSPSVESGPRIVTLHSVIDGQLILHDQCDGVELTEQMIYSGRYRGPKVGGTWFLDGYKPLPLTQGSLLIFGP
jgi:hypothetical protein